MTAVSGRSKPEICPLPGWFWVNTLAQGVLRLFTQWPWIEHPTFQLRGGHFTTELVRPLYVSKQLAAMWQKCIKHARSAQRIMAHVNMQLCNSSFDIQWQRRGVLNYCQGRDDVRWRPGQEASLGPYVRTWGLSEANVLHWSSCDIVRTFASRSHSAPGELCPCPSSLRPRLLREATRLNKSWYIALTRGIREPWGFKRGKSFNSPEFLRQFEEKRTGEFFRAMVLFQKLAQIYRKDFPEFFIFPESPPTSYAYSFDAVTLAKY